MNAGILQPGIPPSDDKNTTDLRAPRPLLVMLAFARGGGGY